MATTGTITISLSTSGGSSGARNASWTIPITSGVDTIQTVSLSSGANTITCPSGATTCIILGANATNPLPNPVSTVTLTAKGVTGDTGLSISAAYPFVWPVGTLPATFCLTASGATTVEILFA